jgi:hypothetical protein
MALLALQWSVEPAPLANVLGLAVRVTVGSSDLIDTVAV